MVCHVCNTERRKTVPGLQGRIRCVRHADDKLFLSGQVCTGEQQEGWQKGILKLFLNGSLTLMRSAFCAGVMLEDTR